MWARIGSVIKSFVTDKAKEKAMQKATGSDSNIFGNIGVYLKLTAIAIPVIAIIILLLTPLIMVDKAFGNIYVIQAADPDFDSVSDSDYSSSSNNAWYCDDLLTESYNFEEYVKITGIHKTTDDPNVKKALENSKFKSVEGFNEYLRDRVDAAGYGTRAGVVAAAITMSGEYSKYTEKRMHYYRWGYTGKRYKNNIDGFDPNDATNVNTDCSHFAWWVLYTGGFKRPSESSTAKIEQWMKEKYNHYSKGVTASNGKPGDFILWRTPGKRSGHIAVIVGKYTGGYYLAESKGAGKDQGIGVQITKSSLKYIKNHSGTDYLIDMTDYYNDQNNVRKNAQRQNKAGTTGNVCN